MLIARGLGHLVQLYFLPDEGQKQSGVTKRFWTATAARHYRVRGVRGVDPVDTMTRQYQYGHSTRGIVELQSLTRLHQGDLDSPNYSSA